MRAGITKRELVRCAEQNAQQWLMGIPFGLVLQGLPDSRTRRMRDRLACLKAPSPVPGLGPLRLESVLNRRLNSQNVCVVPSAVVTRYVSPQRSSGSSARGLPRQRALDRAGRFVAHPAMRPCLHQRHVERRRHPLALAGRGFRETPWRCPERTLLDHEATHRARSRSTSRRPASAHPSSAENPPPTPLCGAGAVGREQHKRRYESQDDGRQHTCCSAPDIRL